MPAAVLFDVDGTLIDSTYLHTVSWWQAFRRRGEDVVMSRIHRCIGMGAEQLVPEVLDRDVDEDEIASLAETHDAAYSTYWPSLRTMPGARELVRRCHEDGLTTVLASSAGEDEVATVRALLDIDDALDASTSSSDAERSKPHPDLVEIALGRADTRDAIMIGDATADILACASAGIPCMAVTCGGTSAAELRSAGAVAVYADPADLVKQWADSALGG